MMNVRRYLLGVIVLFLLMSTVTSIVQVAAGLVDESPRDKSSSTTASQTTATTTSTTVVSTTNSTLATTTTTTTTQVPVAYPVPFTPELQDWVNELCEYYDFEERLIYQIIRVESDYNPRSENSICKGLMQVHMGYVDHYAQVEDDFSYVFKDGFDKTKDVLDPYKNILLGIRVLDEWRGYCKQRGYNRVLDWLCAYNAGWRYMETHNTHYGNWVLSIDLDEIDFSNYEVVG